MPEKTFTCAEHPNTPLRGKDEEELAKNIQKHVKDIHKQDIPMEEARKMASRSEMK